MSKIMLINILQPEECRIAILENGVLEELYVERTSHESYVGNIYKGRIVNIEPSIQAAFVDFGVGRNGFLHVSDVEPTYYRHLEPQRGEGRRDDRGRARIDLAATTVRRVRTARRVRTVRRAARNVEKPPLRRDRSHVRPRLPRPQRGFAADILEEIEATRPIETEVHGPDELPVEVPFFEETAVEETTAEQQPEPEMPPPVEVVTTAIVETAPEPPAEELAAETTEEKPRRRTTRRKKEDAAAPTKRRRKKTADSETETPPGEEPPPPEVMGSAERRTDEGDDSPDPPPSGIDADDDDIFSFRRSRPAATPRNEPERPRAIPPAPRNATRLARIFRSLLSSRPLHAARFPPSRPRLLPPRFALPSASIGTSAGGANAVGGRAAMKGGAVAEVGDAESIEDQLEADLAAAEVAAVRDLNEPRQAAEPWPVEAPPLEEVAEEEVSYQAEPDAEEAGWEEEVPDRGNLDPDEDFGRPPPRDDRRERSDRGERGGRGERGRGDRGDRGDRRGGDRGGPRRGGRPGGGRPTGRDGTSRPKPLIQDIFKRGQEVIVQVIKEHLGTKGPTLSTYISIPGRYLVLMPGLNRVGVSRKIEDEDQRRRLKAIFEDLQPPEGVGFIIRTAGEDKSAKELQRDLAYLSRLWQVVVRRIRKQKAPAEIYQESDMITRHIRDTFTADVDKIYIDEPAAFEAAKEFLSIVMPRYADRLELYDGTEPLFHKYGIEQEIEKIQQKKVPLPNGGSIVIEQTEALVAIDVNSGNFRADRNDAEETAYQINLQAAKEIARQLRLRDLAGVIVNDFIDMRDEKHRRTVERAVRDAMERDRARIKVLRMSQFGIIEMTRQRVRTSLKRSVYHECHHCSGSGHVKTPESMSLDVIRLVQVAACREYIRSVSVTVTEEVANYLHNRKRKELAQLEQLGKMAVQITGKPGAGPETMLMTCYDQNNNEVKLQPQEERRPQRGEGRR